MSSENKTSTPGQKKELPMEMRLLLAFVLMGVVLFTTPYFFKSAMPPPPVKKAAAPQKPASNPPAPAAVTPAAGDTEPPPHPAQVSAQKEQTFVVDTELYQVVFSNRGAVVRNWILKKYTDSVGKPLDLVNTAATAQVGFPFALFFKNQKPSVDLNEALFVAQPAPDGLRIRYEFAQGRLLARKTFQFQKNGYLAQVSTEVTDYGAALPHLIAWRGGFGDAAIQNPSSQHSIHFDVTDSKLITQDAKAAKNGPVSAEGTYSFAGMEDTYFAAVFLPNGSGSVEAMTFNDPVPTIVNPKEEPHVGTAVGGAGRNDYSAFVGPKDIDILQAVNPKLVKIVDFGWFAFLAKPLYLAVHWVSDRWVRNYGWSIVIVTIFINFLLFPLRLTNMKSMKKMQALQPQIAAINERYKNIGLRDPRKQQQNEEVMALYKKHGANPMGGCMPMLLQIPFFIAFYKVLSVSIEMRHASWLWVGDLSRPEQLPIRILPIAMIVTQFLMQKMTPTATVDPNQQKMMLMMPLVMGFFFYGLPSGLVLYYLTVNLVGIAQQWFFNKTLTAADVAQPAPVAKKKNGRK